MWIPFAWPTEHTGAWTIGAIIVVCVMVWALDKWGGK